MSEIEVDLESTYSSSLLLVTTVELGGGRTGTVEVRAGDDPADIARAFCARHGLPDTVVAPLALHLKENLDVGSVTVSGGVVHNGGDMPWIIWAVNATLAVLHTTSVFSIL